jgi:hypothetical protein
VAIHPPLGIHARDIHLVGIFAVLSVLHHLVTIAAAPENGRPSALTELRSVSTL